MEDKTKLILGIVSGVVIAILLFCLIVVIGCSVNGLTFGEQITSWFGHHTQEIVETAEEVAETLSNTPVV